MLIWQHIPVKILKGLGGFKFFSIFLTPLGGVDDGDDAFFI